MSLFKRLFSRKAAQPPRDYSRLPEFKYHPDPLATGSIVKSDAKCVCCGQKTGYVYAGPVYAEEELDEMICPWCIADGSAHRKFDAEFTDPAGIGGYGETIERVDQEVMLEVACRTPGYAAWQEAQWWTHCGDAAAYLGPAGKAEVEAYGEELIVSLRENSGIPEKDWERHLNELSKDGSPTAYVFRCRHCGQVGGYCDFH